MKEKNTAYRKPLAWASFALGAFTALSVVVPIVWDRLANRDRK